MSLSKCCKSQVHVEGSEYSQYFVCETCGRACDLFIPRNYENAAEDEYESL